MRYILWQFRSKVWRLPATFVAVGLGTGLLVDTYRAWAVSDAVLDCQPQFAVLYFTQLQAYRGTPTFAEKQAILQWEQRVREQHGTSYAKFDFAREAVSGAEQCYPDLDSGPKYCGFASGQPCRRTKSRAPTRVRTLSSPEPL